MLRWKMWCWSVFLVEIYGVKVEISRWNWWKFVFLEWKCGFGSKNGRNEVFAYKIVFGVEKCSLEGKIYEKSIFLEKMMKICEKIEKIGEWSEKSVKLIKIWWKW